MGIIEERRRLITAEMEAGRGSEHVLPHPVSLEPPFKPFNLRRERTSLLSGLLKGRQEERTTQPEPTAMNNPRFIRIKPSVEDKNALEMAERFILSLPTTSPVAFEVIGHGGRISFQLLVEEAQAEAAASQVGTHFPGSDVYPDADLLQSQPIVLAHSYRLKTSHFFPLSSIIDGDQYRTLFACLGTLGLGQIGVLQVLIAPVKEDWQANMQQASRNVYDSSSPFIDLPQLPKSVDKKLTRPLFAVSLRLAASDKALLSRLEGFLKQFENTENGIIPVSDHYPIESIMARNSHVHGCLLNSSELSYILHLPAPDLLESLPCIERAAKSYAVPDDYTLNGPVLGINIHRGIKKPVCHSRVLPNRHVYVTGKSGYGKSNLMLYVVMQRIENGEGIGLLDPHGELAKDILRRIPKKRVDDVVHFNAGDFKHPMAINPLAHGGTKLEKEHIRVDLLNFFEDLFEAPLGVNVLHTLSFSLTTLLTRQDSTLQDIERLLIDKGWRAEFLKSVEDERVLMFWEHEFPQLERRGITIAITNKLSPLILPDSTIAPMLKQRENKVDFLEIMNDKKVFIANLSHGEIGKRNSQLLGKLLVSKLQIAAVMRESNGTSPDFFLHVDEFQHATCPSMADVLSGARKYGLHLWLTNQMTGDIPDYILRSVFNSSTLVAFATDSPNDQMLIERHLSKKFKAEDIGQLKRGEAYVKMVGSAFNMVTERVSEAPRVNWVDEIIASSREKYTSKETAALNARDDKAGTSHREGVNVSQDQPILSSQEKSFLEGVLNNPLLHIRSLYKAQGLSGYMGDKLKSAVKEKGLVSEVTTSRLAKHVVLTSQGLKALNIEFGPDTGKGGPVHRYWQSVVRFHAEAKGYRAAIEEPVPGGKETVDVGLEKDGSRVAVEISITTKAEHELSNVRKCLQAGYSQIITLFFDEAKLAEFKTLIEQALTDEERSRVLAGPSTAFCQIL